MLYEKLPPRLTDNGYHRRPVRFCDLGLRYEPAHVYGEVPGKKLLMDILYSKSVSGKKPCVIWIHGGAWNDPKLTRVYRPDEELAELARMGFFVAAIDYRLVREAPWPAQIEDCKCAVRFLRANADKYGIDPDKIAVWGESAGGHLAGMVATTPDMPEFEGNGGCPGVSSAVQAAVLWYMPDNMLMLKRNDDPASLFAQMFGGADEAAVARAVAASPITYADRKLPPILLMHGTRDAIVPIECSERFRDKALAAGNDVRMIHLPGQGHGFFSGDEYYQAVYDFFADKLQGRDRHAENFAGEGGTVVWAEPTDWDALGATVIADVPYTENPHKRQYLDIILPKDEGKPFPVAVWFHGGGFNSEELTRLYRPEPMLAELVKRGIACVSADYRLLRDAPFPAQAADPKCVIRFLRANADKYNLDPDNIGVWGESAGGNIALMLAVAEHMRHGEGEGGWTEYPSTVKCAISWYGGGNAVKRAELSGMFKNRFGDHDYDYNGPGAQQIWETSPYAYAYKKLPPILFMHGTSDPLVAPWQSQDMYDAMIDAGNEAELVMVPGWVHGFFVGEENTKICCDFFEKHLK